MLPFILNKPRIERKKEMYVYLLKRYMLIILSDNIEEKKLLREVASENQTE